MIDYIVRTIGLNHRINSLKLNLILWKWTHHPSIHSRYVVYNSFNIICYDTRCINCVHDTWCGVLDAWRLRGWCVIYVHEWTRWMLQVVRSNSILQRVRRLKDTYNCKITRNTMLTIILIDTNQYINVYCFNCSCVCLHWLVSCTHVVYIKYAFCLCLECDVKVTLLLPRLHISNVYNHKYLNILFLLVRLSILVSHELPLGCI